jgi:hypothetical protein
MQQLLAESYSKIVFLMIKFSKFCLYHFIIISIRYTLKKNMKKSSLIQAMDFLINSKISIRKLCVTFFKSRKVEIIIKLKMKRIYNNENL